MWINNVHYLLTKFVAQITSFIIKTLNLGVGYTWPGHIALKLYPNILADKNIKFKKGIIIISGTNGKTTTAKIITSLLTYQGAKVIHNTSGANLLNGIVSACLLSDMGNADYGVFEVDEFALPRILSYLSPDVLLLLNLSRDQLDRYGETDIIFEKWLNTVATLRSNCFLLLNHDQHEFSKFHSVFNGRIMYFDANPKYLSKTPFEASFYAYNLNASLLTISVLGLDNAKAVESLDKLQVAYGRGELVSINNKSVFIFLNKNPRSANINLSSIKPATFEGVIFLLNDNIPDGRDISWIYDIDPDLLSSFCLTKYVFVSGTRALEMSSRLVYAGIDIKNITTLPNMSELISFIKTSKLTSFICFPNYSAMLDFRKLTLGRSIL